MKGLLCDHDADGVELLAADNGNGPTMVSKTTLHPHSLARPSCTCHGAEGAGGPKKGGGMKKEKTV